MNDLLSEHRLSLTQLAHKEGVAIPTTWRWAQRGIKDIRLETIQIGGRRYTSTEAFHRFVQATTAVANGERPKVRTNRQRNTAINRSERTLDQAGM